MESIRLGNKEVCDATILWLGMGWYFCGLCEPKDSDIIDPVDELLASTEDVSAKAWLRVPLKL
eukprot:2201907-Amphidinium_carterae.1